MGQFRELAATIAEIQATFAGGGEVTKAIAKTAGLASEEACEYARAVKQANADAARAVKQANAEAVRVKKQADEAARAMKRIKAPLEALSAFNVHVTTMAKANTITIGHAGRRHRVPVRPLPRSRERRGSCSRRARAPARSGSRRSSRSRSSDEPPGEPRPRGRLRAARRLSSAPP